MNKLYNIDYFDNTINFFNFDKTMWSFNDYYTKS